MKSPTSERGGSNRNTKGDEIADERARSEEQNPQRGFCDERRASEEEARLLKYFVRYFWPKYFINYLSKIFFEKVENIDILKFITDIANLDPESRN